MFLQSEERERNWEFRALTISLNYCKRGYRGFLRTYWHSHPEWEVKKLWHPAFVIECRLAILVLSVVIHRGEKDHLAFSWEEGGKMCFSVWYIITYKPLKSTWWASAQGFNDPLRGTKCHWYNIIAHLKNPQCIILIRLETGFSEAIVSYLIPK